jgi:signal transduction histidine kinase
MTPPDTSLPARLVAAQDEARRRLERNLHDGAQQRLVGISLALRLALGKLPGDPEAGRELVAAAADELARALEELRELARDIHPAQLTDRGLAPAVRALALRVPVRIELRDLPEERLPPAVEAAAYFVVAESLTNAAKHARATAVSVAFRRGSGDAWIEVADDGCGGADPALGSGLRGLADRVEALDGKLSVVSPPGGGTVVSAAFPVA